jgi:hypothetical protein
MRLFFVAFEFRCFMKIKKKKREEKKKIVKDSERKCSVGDEWDGLDGVGVEV